jgi:hypothetical protein
MEMSSKQTVESAESVDISLLKIKRPLDQTSLPETTQL